MNDIWGKEGRWRREQMDHKSTYKQYDIAQITLALPSCRLTLHAFVRFSSLNDRLAIVTPRKRPSSLFPPRLCPSKLRNPFTPSFIRGGYTLAWVYLESLHLVKHRTTTPALLTLGASSGVPCKVDLDPIIPFSHL